MEDNVAIESEYVFVKQEIFLEETEELTSVALASDSAVKKEVGENTEDDWGKEKSCDKEEKTTVGSVDFPFVKKEIKEEKDYDDDDDDGRAEESVEDVEIEPFAFVDVEEEKVRNESFFEEREANDEQDPVGRTWSPVLLRKPLFHSMGIAVVPRVALHVQSGTSLPQNAVPIPPLTPLNPPHSPSLLPSPPAPLTTPAAPATRASAASCTNRARRALGRWRRRVAVLPNSDSTLWKEQIKIAKIMQGDAMEEAHLKRVEWELKKKMYFEQLKQEQFKTKLLEEELEKKNSL